ncbi:GHKL domain-containing protein [Streptococcus ruminicola]|uniref:sensor histidine kinase n=1 Tax=Streptococcus ruminicola TaxID=2686210 RepID=UPI003F5FC3B1
MSFFEFPITLEYEGHFFLKWVIILLIFRQISLYKLNWKYCLGIPLFLTFLEVFYYDIVGLFEILLLPIVLMVVNYRNKLNWTKTQFLFYSFFPFSVVTMFINLATSFILFCFKLSLNDWWEYRWSDFVTLFLGTIFCYLFYNFVRLDNKIIHSGLNNLKLKKVVNSFVSSIVIYSVTTFGLEVLYYIETKDWFKTSIDIIHIRRILPIVYFFIMISFLFYISEEVKKEQEAELLSLKDQQLNSMSSYSEHIESLYTQIRGFRHDYTNLLVSLNEAINSNDMPAVKNIYNAVLADSGKSLNSDSYQIGNLAKIGNPSIKSIISAKLMEAHQKGITLTVEVEDYMDSPKMELLDFIRILSILLDNAIEATESCQKPSLVFAFFKDKGSDILIVENSTEKKRVNTKTIFQRGFSSKGDNRGIGLANVKEILDKYDNVILNTTSVNYQFRQEMRIE